MKLTKPKKLFLIFLVIIVLFAIYMASMGSKADFFEIKSESYEEKILASGTLTLSDTVELRAPVRGLVTSIKIEEGDSIEAGQELVLLDTKDINLQIKELLAGKAVLDAQLSELSSKLYPNALQLLSQAKLNEAEALKNFENAKLLYDAGAISKNQYIEIENRYNLVKSETAIAKNNSNALSNNGSSKSQLSAEINRLSTQILSLENERSKYTIVSPIKGTIIEIFSAVGEIEERSTPLLTIIRDETALVEVPLDERYISSIEKGQKVLVSSDAYASEKLEGVIASISPSVDIDTGTILLKVRLNENRPYLIKNLTVRCEIITGIFENSIAIPEKFLFKENGSNFVFVFENGKAVKRNVLPALNNTARVRITEGLFDGETILLPNGLKDGDSVRLSGVDGP